MTPRRGTRVARCAIAAALALGPRPSAGAAAQSSAPAPTSPAAIPPQAAASPMACAAGAPSGPPASGPRGAPGLSAQTADLHCIELFAAAAAPGARGAIALGRVPSPFGVTVTPEGHHVRELKATIEGLPTPEALGPYTAYVAWATPLELDPVVKLAAVGNGEFALGRVAFNKYLIWISAEASPEVEVRSGPLVLRGRSPSTRMEAHDLLAQAPSATQRAARSHAHVWEHPPTYADIPMLPGMMDLEPRATPFLPDAGSLADVPASRPHEVIRLPDGGTLDLEAGFVRRTIAGRDVVMLAFNGQHPGPLLEVPARATIFVDFVNRTPLPTTVHWHGVRLDNRFDGVRGLTQREVAPGERFRYRVFFRDAGIYWYHPHHREDIQQELGLYGNILVAPSRPDYYGPVDREAVLMLDDILLDRAGVVPFGGESANYMLMGRFGNLALVNGEPDYRLEVARGEVVRFYLTNASNTRTFNLSFVPAEAVASLPAGSPALPPGDSAPRLPIKVVASDVSRFEREELARSVVLAPAERYVVEVRFDAPGAFALVNHVQGVNHRQGVFRAEAIRLGTVEVTGTRTGRPAPSTGPSFETLREHAEVVADIDPYRDRFDAPPDRELVLTLEVEDLPPAIEQSMLYDWVYFNPVEWTGTMPMMNWATTGREVRWVLRDAATGRENEDIAWTFRVGDVVKLRLHNDRSAFHAMQHPLHIHGQRFLVLAQDGVPNHNLAWKDTVLVPAGSTTDILLELSNPGRWMVHCHVAEHLESGMRLVIDVAPE